MRSRPTMIALATGAAALLVGLGVTTAAPDRPLGNPPATTTEQTGGGSLTLDTTTVNATWKESWLSGNVAFSGTASGASSLSASLRRTDPTPTIVAARKVFSAGPGEYNGTLDWPHRALPGTYLLRVTGTSGDTKLAPVEKTLTLPAPDEGVIDRSAISLTPGGPAVRRVNGRVKTLYARFHFIVPPKTHVIRFVWRTPSFNFIGEARKHYQASLDTFLKSPTPLARGTWYVLAQVNENVTKRIAVQVG